MPTIDIGTTRARSLGLASSVVAHVRASGTIHPAGLGKPATVTADEPATLRGYLSLSRQRRKIILSATARVESERRSDDDHR
jgi:hypothetical protein